MATQFSSYQHKDRINGKAVTLVVNARYMTFEGDRWQIASQMMDFAAGHRGLIKDKTLWISSKPGVSLAPQIEQWCAAKLKLPEQMLYVLPLDSKIYVAELAQGFVQRETLLDLDAALVALEARQQDDYTVCVQSGGELTEVLNQAGYPLTLEQGEEVISAFSQKDRFRFITLTLLINGYPHWHLIGMAIGLLILLLIPLLWSLHRQSIEQELAERAAELARMKALEERRLAVRALPKALAAQQLPALGATIEPIDVWVSNGLERLSFQQGHLTLHGIIRNSYELKRLLAIAETHQLPLNISAQGWLIPGQALLPVNHAGGGSSLTELKPQLAELFNLAERFNINMQIRAVASDGINQSKATLAFNGRYQFKFFIALAGLLHTTPASIDRAELTLQPGGGHKLQNLTLSVWGRHSANL